MPGAPFLSTGCIRTGTAIAPSDPLKEDASMAEPRNRNLGPDRDRYDDVTGVGDEEIAGRLSDDDVDEFEDTEDLDEEDVVDESDR
jgi:hypothetical protein